METDVTGKTSYDLLKYMMEFIKECPDREGNPGKDTALAYGEALNLMLSGVDNVMFRRGCPSKYSPFGG